MKIIIICSLIVNIQRRSVPIWIEFYQFGWFKWKAIKLNWFNEMLVSWSVGWFFRCCPFVQSIISVLLWIWNGNDGDKGLRCQSLWLSDIHPFKIIVMTQTCRLILKSKLPSVYLCRASFDSWIKDEQTQAKQERRRKKWPFHIHQIPIGPRSERVCVCVKFEY